MRKCVCGCSSFDLDVIQEVVCSATIDFSESDDGDVFIDDHEDVMSENYGDVLICQNCGHRYEDIEDIPVVEEQ